MKGLLLLSSGIDSPVAGKMMADKGVDVIALHFNLGDNEKENNKVITLARKIGVKRLLFAELRAPHIAYRENCNPRFTCVFCKRMMLRIAERIAEDGKYDFLITGENLGQVASQTLDNMAVIQSAVKIKVLQPLLGFDKKDTIGIARKYGTYELSIEKSPGCPFLPQNPATGAKLEKVEAEEAKLDIEDLIRKSVESVREVF
jgi:thiamine biosynthesis protein ThiI